MRARKHISYFAILLLLFWISGTMGYAFIPKNIGIVSSEKKKNQKSEQTEITQYQAKALMPAPPSSFVQVSYFLIFETPFIIVNHSIQTFQKPIFKISFFEKVFEHIIAPQAP